MGKGVDLSDVEVESVDELLERMLTESRQNIYGILYGDYRHLKYRNLEARSNLTLASTTYVIRDILAMADEIYLCSNPRRVSTVFGDFKSKKRGEIPDSLSYHKGKILDCGGYGLYDTLKDRVLISEDMLKQKGLKYLVSLAVAPDGVLYSMTCQKDGTHSLMEILENNGRYSLGEEILRYGDRHKYLCQAIILPWGSFNGADGKNHEFSVMSCAHPGYIDLNEKQIIGSQLYSEKICRMELLSLEDHIAEVLVSGKHFRNIRKYKINLKKMEVMTKDKPICYLSEHVYGIEIVRNKALHNRIVEESKTHYLLRQGKKLIKGIFKN